MQTVLVLGGYGNFGACISRTLARDDGVLLLIAGRDERKARRFAAALGLPERCGIAFDAGLTTLARQLHLLEVDILIHAAGPFQGQDYRVAQACIEAGCHYIDLADGRDFVAGISGLDGAARAAGVLVTSGASSVPALSAAVVDYLLPEFSRLDTIRHAIAYDAKTPGLATLQAVLGYAGQPLMRMENGVWKRVYGWQDLQHQRYPAPVGRRWLVNGDAPDLSLFPQRYPGVRTVTFQAGLGSPLSHLAGWTMSWLVRWGWASNLARWAKPLRWISRHLEFAGSASSAMHVALSGMDRDGRPLARAWYILASRRHAVYIPCGAAILLARKLVRGAQPERGAMACTGLFTLEEYMDALAGLEIRQVFA